MLISIDLKFICDVFQHVRFTVFGVWVCNSVCVCVWRRPRRQAFFVIEPLTCYNPNSINLIHLINNYLHLIHLKLF